MNGPDLGQRFLEPVCDIKLRKRKKDENEMQGRERTSLEKREGTSEIQIAL